MAAVVAVKAFATLAVVTTLTVVEVVNCVYEKNRMFYRTIYLTELSQKLMIKINKTLDGSAHPSKQTV